MTRKVTEAEVIASLQRVGTEIPVAYYLGTALHESGFDLDTVTIENGGASPTSYGLYQVNYDEMAKAGVSGDILDLDTNTRVMVYLAERNRNAIRAAVGLSGSDPDPRDMGGYLAVAHNQGIGAALQTIASYPTGDPTYLGWDEYQQRNWCNLCGCDGGRICSYGDDCLYDPVTGVALVTRTPIVLLGMSFAFLLFTFAVVKRRVPLHV